VFRDLEKGGEKVNQTQVLNFLGFWVAASLVFLIVSLIAPNAVVLGNDKVSGLVAVLAAGFILVAIDYIVLGVLQNLKVKIKNEYAWPLMFFFVNGIVIWLIKRLADITGVGVSSFIYVGVLSLLITAAHFGVTKMTGVMEQGNKSKKN